jgi:predicted component of type VI protein secretion system
MTPQRAMHYAYRDLCAHQLAVYAGMRAALDGVLTRFARKISSADWRRKACWTR